MNSNIVRDVVIIVLIGIVILCFSIILSGDFVNNYKGIIVLALQSLGVTVIVAGIVNCLLSTRNWIDYFSNITKDVLVEDSYLKRLSESKLKDLIVRTLKIYCKNDLLDSNETFFTKFKDDMFNFISAPYREDVTQTIHVSILPSSDRELKIEDKVTYKVHRNNNGYPDIKWIAEENEFKKIEFLSIKIIEDCKSIHTYEGKANNNGDVERSHEISSEIINEKTSNNFDKIEIEVNSTYIIDITHLHCWKMTIPTRNLYFSAVFPNDLGIKLDSFASNSLYRKIDIKDTSASLRYDEWIAPNSGIAWTFYRKESI